MYDQSGQIRTIHLLVGRSWHNITLVTNNIGRWGRVVIFLAKYFHVQSSESLND